MGRRITFIFLAFLLVFSNFTVASAMPTKQLPQQALDKQSLKADEVQETIDPEKEVRVIVEVEDQAPIEYATQRGVKYNDLRQSEKLSLERSAKAKQKSVKTNIEKQRIKTKELQEFTAVINGFSIEVKHADIEKIEKLPDVKAVHLVNEYERPDATPDMVYSKDLVEAQQAWRDYGFKGEGMVVGVIDSGVDPSHRDMVLSDNETGKLTEQFVNDTIAKEDLPGKYHTEKVPYGYNYMDENQEIREIHAGANYHGMHVAGTVGANGDEENGGILGIAPEAQILALKVFGNDPNMQSTFGDIYIKAIDDSIKLGADVLNMSLGSGAGFVNEDSPEQQAVTRAVDNGVLMSISAGNSSYFGDDFFYPYATNPDYGVAGSPGVAYDSLQVASFENSFMDVAGVTYTIDGESGVAAFLSVSNIHPHDVEQKEFEVVNAGLGQPEDFEDIDVEGKYALVQRGAIAFTDKAFNAQDNGAAGIFIYNNEDGIVNMASDPGIKIPQLFMLKSDGDRLAAALNAGQAVTINFEGETTTIDNPDAGKMSDFSSWGLTPNLDFKPEITAPGGQILSTLNDNQYGLMSGTSMAAPHIAGGGALILERVDSEFGYKGANRVNLAENLLLNTAKVVDFDGAPVSPRRQGAGMMQLHSALSTPVVVTESSTNEGKVALKEVTSNTVTFELTAENFSDEVITYEASASVQTDTPVNGGGVLVTAPNMFGAYDLGDLATINGGETAITVPANGKTSFEVTIDVSSVDASISSIFENGYWLEGFVTLSDPTDMNPDLSVPYVGFKGEWDAAPIFDTPMWDPLSFYGMTGIATNLGDDSYGFLGEDLATGAFNPENIAFSPNGDGNQDNALLVVSLMRNVKDASFRVLDQDGEVVRTIRNESFLRKNYYDRGRAAYYTLSSARAWDGKIAGRLAEEGQYYLQAQATIDFPGAKAQDITIPVMLDVTAPEVSAKINQDNNLLTVDLNDGDGSGVSYWDVLVDGESVLEMPYVNGETEHALPEGFDAEEQTVTVVAVDYAGNAGEGEAELQPKDTTAPDLRVETPGALAVSTTKDVEITGYVSDKESGVKEVTVDGNPVELVYDEANERYNFTYTLTHEEDGYYLTRFKAVDNAGNEAEFSRRYFVDSTAASVTITAEEETTEDVTTVKAHIQDRFDQIDVYINGDHVYFNSLSTPYGSKSFDEELEFDLALDMGENVFEFKIVDLSGQETVEYITIEKVEAEEEEPEEPVDPEEPEKPGKPSVKDIVKKVIGKVIGIIGKIWSFFG
ncbi:S8 family serine peptidase [Oceanobacillus sp. CAU 1775]